MAFPVRSVSTFSRNFLLSSRTPYAFKCTQQTSTAVAVTSPSEGRRRRYRLTCDLPGLFVISRLLFERSRSRWMRRLSIFDWTRTLRYPSANDSADSKSSLFFSNGSEPEKPRENANSSNPWGNPRANDNKRPLKLMDFVELMWPHPIKFFRNYIFSVLISGYYDQTFSMSSFLDGAEQAVSVVSGLISKGQFENLDGLVASEAVWELRRNFDLLSSNQRQIVAVNPSDVLIRFVYEIGMIFDDDTDQRFVEITTVFQGFHGFDELKRRNSPKLLDEMFKSRSQIYICNYRFIREFTKGIEDQWLINKLNHFCPVDEEDADQDN